MIATRRGRGTLQIARACAGLLRGRDVINDGHIKKVVGLF
jgi:hypothetical protein